MPQVLIKTLAHWAATQQVLTILRLHIDSLTEGPEMTLDKLQKCHTMQENSS